MTVNIFAPDWNVWEWVELDLEEARGDSTFRQRALANCRTC